VTLAEITMRKLEANGKSICGFSRTGSEDVLADGGDARLLILGIFRVTTELPSICRRYEEEDRDHDGRGQPDRTVRRKSYYTETPMAAFSNRSVGLFKTI